MSSRCFLLFYVLFLFAKIITPPSTNHHKSPAGLSSPTNGRRRRAGLIPSKRIEQGARARASLPERFIPLPSRPWRALPCAPFYLPTCQHRPLTDPTKRKNITSKKKKKNLKRKERHQAVIYKTAGSSPLPLAKKKHNPQQIVHPPNPPTLSTNPTPPPLLLSEDVHPLL